MADTILPVIIERATKLNSQAAGLQGFIKELKRQYENNDGLFKDTSWFPSIGVYDIKIPAVECIEKFAMGSEGHHVSRLVLAIEGKVHAESIDKSHLVIEIMVSACLLGEDPDQFADGFIVLLHEELAKNGYANQRFFIVSSHEEVRVRVDYFYAQSASMGIVQCDNVYRRTYLGQSYLVQDFDDLEDVTIDFLKDFLRYL
jgi:hypothetical protein